MGHCVYVIEHVLSGKKYVGYTHNACNRWREHQISSRRTRRTSYIHKALAKHGVENFTFTVVQECSSKEEGLAAEILWISKLKTEQNGYNLTGGGEGSSHKWTLEQRAAQSARLKGRKLPFEVKQRIVQSLRNYWDVPEHRAHLIQTRNPIFKPIAQYNIDGTLIRVFASLTEASLTMKTSAGNLSSVANGRRPTCLGFCWKYVVDQTTESV